MSDYHYDCVVVDVHDGDTIKVDLDLGFSQWIHGLSLRLFGINAPELNTPAGKVSAAFLKQQLPKGSRITVETIKDKQEKYGRILAKIYQVSDPNGVVAVNDLLVSKGLAKPWDGQGEKPV